MTQAIDRLIELEEQAIAKQRERLAHNALMGEVIEALPDGLIVTDPAGKIVLFNHKAEFMFGYRRDEVIGETVEKLMPERARSRHARDREMYNRFDLSQRAIRMGAVGTNLVGVRNDGHEFLTDITLARMIGPNGIYNLALVRFAVQPDDLGTADHSPAERDQDSGPEIDEADAGR